MPYYDPRFCWVLTRKDYNTDGPGFPLACCMTLLQAKKLAKQYLAHRANLTSTSCVIVKFRVTRWSHAGDAKSDFERWSAESDDAQEIVHLYRVPFNDLLRINGGFTGGFPR